MRSTPGNSFGPIAISATTAMTTISLQPMSNMKDSAHAKFAPRMRRRPRLPWFGSDRLAADVLSRCRRRRRIVIDGLHRLRLVGRGLVILHALLEGLDALGNVTHQIRNLAAAEQQQDDCDHHDPVPNAKRTHPATLQTGNGQSSGRSLGRKVGPRGVKNKDFSPRKSLRGLPIMATVNRTQKRLRN